MKTFYNILFLFLMFAFSVGAKPEQINKNPDHLEITKYEITRQKVDGREWAVLKANLRNSSKQNIHIGIQKAENKLSEEQLYHINEPFVEIEVKAAGTDFWYPITRMGSWTKNTEHVLKPGDFVWIEKKLVVLPDINGIQKQLHQSYIKNGFRITIKGRIGSSEGGMVELFKNVVFFPESGDLRPK